MILSNVGIQQALDDRRLIIDPEPQPRRRTDDTTKCPYDTSSVDLRLGNEIAFFREGLAVSIDLRRGSFAHLFGPNSQTFTITEQQPFALQPGKFILGKTLERIELPLVDDGRRCLAARVEGKSSYARCGMLVHFTAPTVHAGFDGTLTLEIINLGPLPILLYPGAYICQLVLEEVDSVPFRNDSQFKGQVRAGGGT